MQRHLPVCVVILLFASQPALAELRLPAIFTDHLVLQRDLPAPVWGWADPGDQITVEIAGEKATATADHEGKWMAKLEPLPEGGPHTLTVTAGDETLTRNDVLVGEVWLASGQSNMEWPVSRSIDAEAEIAAADYPRIRLFSVARKVSREPLDDVTGQWRVCSPETVGAFSAVAYYFGRQVHRELEVPVGLIDSSWGGTFVEAWTSHETLAATPEAQPILERFEKALADYPQKRAEWEKQVAAFDARTDQAPTYHSDPGNTGAPKGYAQRDFDDSGWQTARLPGNFDDTEAFDGVVWYRRTVEIPAAWAGKPLTLSLGPIDDFDVTYFNGVEVGSTTEPKASAWEIARTYEVPAEAVKPGPATIAIRVFDHFGGGGIGAAPGGLRLTPADADPLRDGLSLAGDWKMHVEHRLEPSAITGPGGSRRPREPLGPTSPHGPSALYNGMIHPLVPYTLAGVLWYQGESNANRAEQYETLLPGLIADWRNQWGDSFMPFLFVQLAGYMAPSEAPTDTPWAHLRDAQLHTLRTVPHTGMAVAIDIGEADDVHPRNKQDVGRRLARWALADVYGRDVVKSGPIARADDVAFDDRHALIFFDHAQQLRTRDGGPLQGFTAAGPDGKFVKAKARIVEVEGRPAVEVELPADAGDTIAAVRYAWANNPTEANLINGENLPATPFRTDDFAGPTDGKR